MSQTLSCLQLWIEIGIPRPGKPTHRTSRQRRELYQDRGGRPAGNDPYAKSGWESECGDNRGKGVGSSGNDEDTEDGNSVCTVDEVERRQATEDGGGLQDDACRRRR